MVPSFKKINSEPALNNNGDVVWYAYDMDSYHRNQIMFYDRLTGNVTQLTNDRGHFYLPVINDYREIVWEGKSPLHGPIGPHIYFYEIDIDKTQDISKGPFGGIHPRINDQGDIIYLGSWVANSGPIGLNSQWELFLATKKEK